MLTREANERLTRVGPGTPMGNLLRRYWHAIAATAELDKEPVLPVKILGENLALYRSPDGELGLMAERCPHRGASMVYGIPEEGGLRCPYHGWKFSTEGTCIEQPAEPENSTFKHRVRIPAYPVQELGGLIWAYLGPAPAPLLPRWDILVSDEYERKIGISHLPCNWLQPMENSMDPIHFEWLHAVYGNYIHRKQCRQETMTPRKHLRIEFDEYEFGISKRRLLEGDTEESDDWTVGHPVIFPTILAVGDSTRPSFQIRVPQDDTTTLHFWYRAVPRKPDAPMQTSVPIYDYPHAHPDGKIVVETVQGQDMMAWITQGEISDRTTERLGNSDKGIILYRSLLMREMERVAAGEDPMGILRDQSRNEPFISIPREGHALQALNVRRDLISQNLKALTGSEV